MATMAGPDPRRPHDRHSGNSNYRREYQQSPKTYCIYEELAPNFEERLLNIVKESADNTNTISTYHTYAKVTGHPYCSQLDLSYTTSKTFTILVGLCKDEKERWLHEYQNDKAFAEVLAILNTDEEWI